MRITANVHKEEGFTIQELLVVLIVSSLLVGFCFLLFSFTHKFLISWQRKTEIHSVVDRTMNAIMLDVQQSKQIKECTDSTLVLLKNGNRQIIYHFDGTSIFRNNDAIASFENMKISVFISKGIRSQTPARAPIVTIKIAGKS